MAYDDKKDFLKAIADYTKTIELDPKGSSAYYNRGLTYDNTKDYYKAIADYSKFIELAPEDPDGYTSLGYVF
jgi:tetratricopeptide (TPR) repeat protein